MQNDSRHMAVFSLIHSPLVGPLTWSRVADELHQDGITAITPALSDAGEPDQPYWQRHSRSAAQAIATATRDRVVLVGHSGAGQLLPAITAELRRLRADDAPVAAYIFVDAGLPGPAGSRLERLGEEDGELARQLAEMLAAGERFPNWSEADLRAVIPDANLRRGMVADLHPRGLDFWSETIPAFPDWPDAPCAYLQFTSSYDLHARQAQDSGWPYRRLEVGHFHMLVEPGVVTGELLGLAKLLKYKGI